MGIFKTIAPRSGIKFHDDRMTLEYEIGVANSGQSPALQVAIHSEIFAPLESAARIEEIKAQIRRGDCIPTFKTMLTPGAEYATRCTTNVAYDSLRTEGSGTAIAPVLAAFVSYQLTLGDEIHLTCESILLLRKGRGPIEPGTEDISAQDLWTRANLYAPGSAD